MGKGMIKIVTLDFYLQFKENALHGGKACYNIVGEVHLIQNDPRTNIKHEINTTFENKMDKKH